MPTPEMLSTRVDKNITVRREAAALVGILRAESWCSDGYNDALALYFAFKFDIPSSPTDYLNVLDLQEYMNPIISAIGEHIIVDVKSISAMATKHYKNRYYLAHDAVKAVVVMNQVERTKPGTSVLLGKMLNNNLK